MRTRRGASFYRGELARMLAQFYPGALVGPLTVQGPSDSITGIVKSVNPVENKVYVAWNGGAVKQHDPDEIGLRIFPVDLSIGKKSVNTMSEAAKEPSGDDAQVQDTKKLASRRGRLAARKEKCNVGRRMAMIKFMGNKDTHGIDEPISGGTDVMRVLARKLSVEALKYSQDQKGRRMAVYHRMRGRIYRRTKFERDNDTLACPRCRPDLVEMEKQPFVRGTGIWVCPNCGWKITTDKVID